MQWPNRERKEKKENNTILHLILTTTSTTALLLHLHLAYYFFISIHQLISSTLSPNVYPSQPNRRDQHTSSSSSNNNNNNNNNVKSTRWESLWKLIYWRKKLIKWFLKKIHFFVFYSIEIIRKLYSSKLVYSLLSVLCVFLSLLHNVIIDFLLLLLL